MSDKYTSVSEDDRSSEYSSESDAENIRPTKRKKTLVIDCDKEIEHETHTAGECSLVSTEAWIEDNVSRELEDFTGASGVTTEGNNPQNISEVTEFTLGWSKRRSPAMGDSFCKSHLVNNEWSQGR